MTCAQRGKACLSFGLATITAPRLAPQKVEDPGELKTPRDTRCKRERGQLTIISKKEAADTVGIGAHLTQTRKPRAPAASIGASYLPPLKRSRRLGVQLAAAEPPL
ncbi:hypothetical protein H4582DRAFT_2058891 [Lactarius indigo]|nr:hypothetical protein H4582DRAFT_2058891 [Lactarius indigo]